MLLAMWKVRNPAFEKELFPEPPGRIIKGRATNKPKNEKPVKTHYKPVALPEKSVKFQNTRCHQNAGSHTCHRKDNQHDQATEHDLVAQ